MAAVEPTGDPPPVRTSGGRRPRADGGVPLLLSASERLLHRTSLPHIMTEVRKEENTISTIRRMLDNVQSLIDFDNRVYVAAFGEKAVYTIQKQAERMPDTDKNGFAIQAMLNIGYDQGYQDCIDMIRRVIDSAGAL